MAEGALLHVSALRSLPLFLDVYEAAIASIESKTIECQPVRKASDGIGAHWYGMRVRVRCKKTGLSLYLHTGLIFHPDTRKGLMIEVDRRNHFAVYSLLWEQLKPGDGFEVERQEEDYLKIFMPDADYDRLGGSTLSEQMVLLQRFFQQAVETIAAVLEKNFPGFCFPTEEMDAGRELLCLLNEALDGLDSPLFDVERVKDPDNLGAYALGSRYWLSCPENGKKLYAYFGVIFSYQKDPAGIFAEVDQHSNPEYYDKVLSCIAQTPGYQLSLKETGFIKLFLPKAHQLSFNLLPRERQLQLLKDFLVNVNRAFLRGLKE